MQCHVCQSTEFILHDGAYFCSECDAVKEASHKEQAEQEGGFSKKSLLKSTQKGKKSKASRHSYSSWITTDGYNLIIYKQVSALISLGASEKLKNVVLYIWSKYLEKCEVAFRTDCGVKEIVPRLSVFPRARDIQVLYGDGDSRRKKYRRKKKTIKRNQSRKDSEIKIEETNISEELESADSETANSASESESSTSGASSASKSHKPYFKLSTHATKIQRSIGKSKLKNYGYHSKDGFVHHMTLEKTLSFCYLGLLYTEDQLLLCDLLRLVKEDKVPYIDVTHVFPPSMQLQGEDENNFTFFAVPTVTNISQTCAKLFEFVKLPDFKHRSIMPIVFRFVKDLNLPDSLIPIVNLVHSKMKGNDVVWQESKDKVPLYDVQAMALIIVVLKLIYVLDGKFELEHSKIMRKINILLKGKKLFVWEDWRQQMLLKEFIFFKMGSNYSDLSHLDKLRAEEIIRKFPMAKLKEFGEFCNRKKSQKQLFFNVGRKEIKTLLENIRDQIDVASFNKTSSFPLKCELEHFTTEGESWQMFKETTKRDLTYLNKSFLSDLIFYKRIEEISEESEELIYILLSSLYESAEIVTLSSYKAKDFKKIIRTSSKYWYSNLNIHKDFRYVKQHWRKKLPATFVWLLQLLSNYMQISCQELFTEVTKIEIQLSLSFKKM